MGSLQHHATFEVVIIGAGLSGIIAAQRYLEAHPSCPLTLLDKDHVVGGVFGKRRSYTNFWAQWTVGVAEFSDTPMPRPPKEDIEYDCFKAKYTTEYLEKYVDENKHGGRSLRDRIQFGVNVLKVEKSQGGWLLSCVNAEGSPIKVFAEKLMVANGQCSLPNMPDLPGREKFDGKIVHSEAFGETKILANKDIDHISVIGGGKSAADMVYEAVKAGKTVSWIIRTSGTGPAFFAPLDEKTPWDNVVEASHTRIMSWLMPCVFNPESLWTWFLHRTMIGISIVNAIFSSVDKRMRIKADYKGRESTKGFEKLEYDTDFFWMNGMGGVQHHEDFWNVIADSVFIHRADVKGFSSRLVYLSDGTQIQCDAVLCGTGYRLGFEIFEPALLVTLDVPHVRSDEPQKMTAKWDKLFLEADAVILKKFPILANPPPHTKKPIFTTPYRLYKWMAPLNDDSILFMGHASVGNKIFAAEVQAIWAVAYFDKNISLPSLAARERSVASHVAWSKRRYLTNGELGNFAAFDTVPYLDNLLAEIGLDAHRKSWWRQVFEPFRPRDLDKAWKQYLYRRSDQNARQKKLI